MYPSLKNQKNPDLVTYGAPELPLLTKNFSGAEMRKNPQNCRSSRDEYWGGQRSSVACNRVIHLRASRKRIRMTLGQIPLLLIMILLSCQAREKEIHKNQLVQTCGACIACYEFSMRVLQPLISRNSLRLSFP